MVDVLVCGASVYETRAISGKTPVLVTGPNNAYAAAHLTASLFHLPPWERPKLIIGVGMASRLDGSSAVGDVVLPDEVSLWPQTDGGADAEDLRDLGMSLPGDVPLGGSNGRMASGDVLLGDDREKVAAQGFSLYDVGGYGVAVASRYANIPCALIRVVSDEGDDKSIAARKSQLDENAKALGQWVASLRERLR